MQLVFRPQHLDEIRGPIVYPSPAAGAFDGDQHAERSSVPKELVAVFVS